MPAPDFDPHLLLSGALLRVAVHGPARELFASEPRPIWEELIPVPGCAGYNCPY